MNFGALPVSTAYGSVSAGLLRPRIEEPSMRQPVTELDARFSDRAAVATDWDQTRRALEDAELFWIATVRADVGRM